MPICRLLHFCNFLCLDRKVVQECKRWFIFWNCRLAVATRPKSPGDTDQPPCVTCHLKSQPKPCGGTSWLWIGHGCFLPNEPHLPAILPGRPGVEQADMCENSEFAGSSPETLVEMTEALKCCLFSIHRTHGWWPSGSGALILIEWDHSTLFCSFFKYTSDRQKIPLRLSISTWYDRQPHCANYRLISGLGPLFLGVGSQ